MNALAIAYYIISRYKEKNKEIINLKLQKLLYYIQGYFLKFFNEKAFKEDIVNWTYGPVVPNVYFKFKVFGPDPIELYDRKEINKAFSLIDQEKNKKELLDEIITKSYSFTAYDLVDMTHEEDPWNETNLNERITNKHIKAYFKNHNPLELRHV